MLKFIHTNKGLIIMCATFSLVNKFPFFSLGTLVGWILFFIGIYFKEKIIIEYLSSIFNSEREITIKILEVLNKKFYKYQKVLKSISKLEITQEENKMIKKLYQIRRIAYKIIKDKK